MEVPKTRILVLSTNGDLAGAPVHVKTICNSLYTEYDFMCVYGQDGPIPQHTRSLGISTHIVPTMRSSIDLARDVRSIISVLNLTRSFLPDVIHAHSTKAGMIARIVSFLTNIPVVFTVHGWGWRGKSRFRYHSVKFVEGVLSRLVSSTYYIFVSKSVAGDARGIVRARPGHQIVIHNGMEDVPIVSMPSTALPPRGDRMSILMVARVDESKDHQTLLKAFASLGPSVELWLCGKGTDEGDFVDVALSLMKGEASGEIRFYGERTDVPALLAACDVFTLVSNFEALPLSIIEAMRAGKPVVATDIGGISELVVPGETGILVEPGDSDGLRRAFSELFDQRVRSQLGAKGRDRYLSNFGLEQMLAGLRRVYGAAARRAPIASSILDS